MLTVADALKLPPLAGARVVAGQAGLGNIVRWVHNAGVPDAPEWLNGGELVLTTAFNMPQTEDEQRYYVAAMAEKHVAGLCVTTGRYIDVIPTYLLEVADHYGFPLIEIPFTARFVDIAKLINERIAEQNMEMVRRAMTINQTLTQLVLEGGNLQDLAHKLAELVGHSISIETERFEAIATVNIAAVDEARRYTQRHGRTDPRLVDALEKRSILPRIRRTLHPLHLEAMPDVGLEMERILAPIVVHGEIYGYMWIIADDHAISDIDRMAIEIGATIAALMMLYQESVQSAEASLKGSLFSQLIQGDTGRETILTDQSLRYGVDLRAPFVLLLLECGDQQQVMPLRQLYRRVNQLVIQHEWQAVAGQFAGQVLLLVQGSEDVPSLCRELARDLVNLGQCARLRIGASAALQGVRQVRVAHQQCQHVLHIARRLQWRDQIVYFVELGYLEALYRAGADSLAGNPYVPVLRRLLDEKQADLFNTLEAYLDAGGNGVQTAELLHIHRSTLNYRLARIVELCGVDLSDPRARMNLQVALKLMRLFEVE